MVFIKEVYRRRQKGESGSKKRGGIEHTEIAKVVVIKRVIGVIDDLSLGLSLKADGS